MPLTPDALTTLAALQSRLGIGGGHGHDAELERIILAQSARLVRLCQRKAFHYQTGVIEHIEGEDTPALLTNYAPITAITAIQLVTGDTAEEIEGDWRVRDERWIERTDGGVFGLTSQRFGLTRQPASATQRQLWRVTLSAGYVTPTQATMQLPRTLPYDLEDACLELCAQSWWRHQRRDTTIKSEKILSASITYASEQESQALPSQVADVIRAYGWHV